MNAPVVTPDHLGRPQVIGPSGHVYQLAYNHGDSDPIGWVDYHLTQIAGGHFPELRPDVDALLDARNELTVEAHP